MSAETTNIFGELSANLDPMVQEFISRATKENIIDLYVEYYNRGVDIEYRPDIDKKEKEKEKAALRLIEHQCEQMIIQKALRENGYDTRMMIKYVKKVGRP